MVLVPEVVDAVGPDVPVLAAGGIGTGRQIAAALALGAQGVWTGSIWLTVAEADTAPAIVENLLAANSRDTVRARVMTGKPARLLRSGWTEAWDRPDAPDPLPMPLQGMLYGEAARRISRVQNKELSGFPVGQIVGRMNQVRPTKDVMFDLVAEWIEATERLAGLSVRRRMNPELRALIEEHATSDGTPIAPEVVDAFRAAGLYGVTHAEGRGRARTVVGGEPRPRGRHRVRRRFNRLVLHGLRHDQRVLRCVGRRRLRARRVRERGTTRRRATRTERHCCRGRRRRPRHGPIPIRKRDRPLRATSGWATSSLDGEGPPEYRMGIVPKDAVTITGNWDVLGLRATASYDYTVDDVFVPDDVELRLRRARLDGANSPARRAGLRPRRVDPHLCRS